MIEIILFLTIGTILGISSPPEVLFRLPFHAAIHALGLAECNISSNLLKVSVPTNVYP